MKKLIKKLILNCYKYCEQNNRLMLAIFRHIARINPCLYLKIKTLVQRKKIIDDVNIDLLLRAVREFKK